MPEYAPYSPNPREQEIHILLIAALNRLGSLTVTEAEYRAILATTDPRGALHITRDEHGTLSGELTKAGTPPTGPSDGRNRAPMN